MSSHVKHINTSTDTKLEECAKALFDISEDLIFILNDEGSFVSVNNFGSISLEYNPEELVGKLFIDIIEESERASTAHQLSKVLKVNQPVVFQTKLLSKNKNVLAYEIEARVVYSDKKLIGLVGAGKNISIKRKYDDTLVEYRNKLAEAERLLDIERSRDKDRDSILDELNKLKNEFISNISHELRTPLASIIGFSETIISDPEMAEEMKNEFNQVILNEGKRLAKLINDILDISQIEVGKMYLSKSEFNFIDLMKEVLDANKSLPGSEKLTWNISIPEEECLIVADKDRIFQVFNGLLNNAVKFTQIDGRITAIVNILKKEIEVIISDTGIGIPENDIPHIFQKFYKVSRPGTETPGAGLGLVFVKQIVDLHKGLITVRSEINKGSTFKVVLPKV